LKKILTYYAIGFLFCSSSSLFAADLIEVYCQALKCDPTFNASYADLLANRENIPISRSELLPRLDTHGQAMRQRIQLEAISLSSLQPNGVFMPTTSTQTFYANAAYYYVKLTQPLFNYKSWAKLQQSKATVLQAEASFCASVQDLMVRVVKAYFDVMTANADLCYTKENKKAVALQLAYSKEQLKVGTLPITNVYEAQARYDVVAAQEINDRYTVALRIEALRTITNQLYCHLKGLGGFLPLIFPAPADINAWACLTEKQNYQLLAARYAALAAKQNIKVQAGDKFPVINSFGENIGVYESNLLGKGLPFHVNILEAGVEVNWSPIQGGGITARTMQARFKYQEACFQEERTHREVVSQARNAYLGIFSSIAKVRAEQQAVCSSQQSLKATIDSYKVGIRTILDVLNQQAQLYDALKEYEKARYNYIYEIVLLKQAAGTLSVEDLQDINCWLCNKIDISLYDALLGC
jgi:outer membrane protein